LSLRNPEVLCDLFADDNSLHSSGSDITVVQQSLQQSLDDVQDWCKYNRMLLNPQKSKSMVITSRQKHQRKHLNLSLTVNHTPITQVKDHKVLGVFIDEELNWQCHINHVSKSLSKNLFLLKQLRNYVNSEATKTFFYAHCLSHINYASTVWCGASANQLKHLNSLHRRAAKIIVPDPTLTTDQKMHALGFLPLQKQFSYNAALHMYKVHAELAPNYLRDVLKHSTDRYGSQKYILPLTRVDIFKTSFSFYGPQIWNTLPAQIRGQKTVSGFKTQLRKYLLVN
jgi:hypothetical protein